jgi:hypothetical protein
VGIRVHVNAATVAWELDRRVDFASPASMRWDEVAGVVECEARDDGRAPACLLVVRHDTWLMDLLPMENEGMADLLAGARERGLMRSWTAICLERCAHRPVARKGR